MLAGRSDLTRRVGVGSAIPDAGPSTWRLADAAPTPVALGGQHPRSGLAALRLT